MATHAETWIYTHTRTHARTLSGRLHFPPSPASNPLPSSGSRKKILIQEGGALLFFRLRLLFRHGRRERCVPVCVCVRERNTHKVKSLRTRHLQPSLLHPSFTSRIQKALLCRGESPNLVVKLSAAGREGERKKTTTMPKLCCALLQAHLQNGLL